MLMVIVRAAAIYVVLLIFLRLAGKRTLGELQPFELVITMVIANLACAPITDTEMSIWTGILPLLVLFVMHLIGLVITSKSLFCRRLMNGSPIIIINLDGIDCSNLKRVHFNMNDLMSGLRQSGYFTPKRVAYAILETNGTLSILENENCQSSAPAVPYMLVCEGRVMNKNIDKLGVTRSYVSEQLSRYHLSPKQVALMLADHHGEIYIQPYHDKYIAYKSDPDTQ